MMTNKELIRKLINYNSDTGIVTRIAKISWKGNIVKCKDFIPQSITPYGYYQMSFLGRPHHLHRLIFLYVKGRFPINDIDHINGDRLDNKWVNLREVTRAENLMNLGVKGNNSSGFMGVHLRKDTNKYNAFIHHKGKKYSLGDYDNIENAVKARIEGEIKFGFHINHGKRQSWVKN